MNTIEIMTALDSNPTTKKMFCGVYPCDHLPKKYKKPALIVSNTDPASKPGTHWIAMYVNKNGNTEFFDSFGLQSALQQRFRSFLSDRSPSGTTTLNAKRLQADFSTTCGNYCCVYLYCRAKGKSFNYFLNKFGKSSFQSNDDKILNMYYTIFPKIKQRSDRGQLGGLVCNQICKSKRRKK